MSSSLMVVTDVGTEGPFSPEQLDLMVHAGRVALDAPSLAQGETEWRPLRDNLERYKKTADHLPTGQVIGIFLLIASIGCLVYALTLDVSVPVAGFGRVNNLGLMADRQTFLILGGAGSLISTLLIIFCRRS